MHAVMLPHWCTKVFLACHVCRFYSDIEDDVEETERGGLHSGGTGHPNGSHRGEEGCVGVQGDRQGVPQAEERRMGGCHVRLQRRGAYVPYIALEVSNNNNNIAHLCRAPLCQSHRGASATAKVYNVTHTARDRITPKLCTYRQWGNAVRGMQTSILLERHLTNEFCSNFL